MSRRLFSVIILVVAGAFGVGCEQPLFPENTPRSQFERYSAQREGVFRLPDDPFAVGLTREELRSRLSPPKD